MYLQKAIDRDKFYNAPAVLGPYIHCILINDNIQYCIISTM